MESVAEDNGIQQLLPYFVQFLSDQIGKQIRDLNSLWSIILLLDSILKNPNFFVEPYLHQFMPPILTSLVAKRLGDSPIDNHWELRDFAAKLLSKIVDKYGSSYQTLQPRISRTLLRSFLDPLKSLTTHYGCIIGLSALGGETLRVLLIPNIKPFLELINSELNDKNPHVVKKCEAQKCFLALENACLLYVEHEIAKLKAAKGANSDDAVNKQILISIPDIEGASMLVECFGERIGRLFGKLY